MAEQTATVFAGPDVRTGGAGDGPGGPVMPTASAIAAQRPLAARGVRLTGGLLHEWQRRNVSASMPLALHQLAAAGNLDNLRLCLQPGRPRGRASAGGPDRPSRNRAGRDPRVRHPVPGHAAARAGLPRPRLHGLRHLQDPGGHRLGARQRPAAHAARLRHQRHRPARGGAAARRLPELLRAGKRRAALLQARLQPRDVLCRPPHPGRHRAAPRRRGPGRACRCHQARRSPGQRVRRHGEGPRRAPDHRDRPSGAVPRDGQCRLS